MTFMLSVILCMGIPMIYLYKDFFRMKHGDEAPVVSPYAVVAMFGGGLVAAGFVTGVLFKPEWRPGHDTNYSPMFFLAGGIVVCFAGAINAFRGSKAPYGSWILAALAGLHLAYSGADHLAFYWDKEKVGIMASELAAEGDVKCPASFIIIKMETNVFRYRCPTVLKLGNELGEPFIPWPAYQEGASEKLPKVVKALTEKIDKEEAERKAVVSNKDDNIDALTPH